MSKAQLTDREEYLLYLIAAWRDENQTSPTRQDIATVMGITPGRATQLVQSLEEKGMLERQRHRRRGIEFTPAGWLKANRGS